MGKLVEKQGRKAMGLRDESSYDCQVAVWVVRKTANLRWQIGGFFHLQSNNAWRNI